MNYFIFTISLLCCFPWVGFSQTTIQGEIKAQGQYVPQASVRLLLPADSSIVAYVFSDEHGKFSLSVNASSPQLLLICTHLAHGQYIQIIDNKHQSLVIEMEGKPLEIPEVKIEVPPLQIHGDTLTYLLNAFSNQKDRTLGDVLKKLPGVEVDMNGAIKYKGSYINKFYVEGKDLMENRYGVITNAMPNQDVQSVEILQNHQPIKMLEGKLPSYETALNIKLKKSVSLSGRAQAGLGANPLLWDTKITPMLFSKKYQMIMDLKSNNIGDNILASYDAINIGAGLLHEESKPIRSGEILQTKTPLLPPLAANTYFDNQSHLFSANMLKSLAKDWEVKFNIDAWHQKTNEVGQENTYIILDNNASTDTLSYIERIANQLTDKNLKGSIFINQNGKSNYLKNRFTFQVNQKNRDNETFLNDNILNQAINTPSWALQNTLNGIKNFGTSQAHQFNYYSHIMYLDNDYDYHLTPTAYFEIPPLEVQTDQSLLQAIGHKSLESNQYISTRFFLKKLNIEPKIAVQTVSSRLTTNLSEGNNTLSENNNHIRNISTLASITMRLKLNKVDFALHTPLHFSYIDVQTNDYELQEKKLFFEPWFNTQWRIANFWEWLIQARLQQNFGNTDQVYDHIIMNASTFQTYPIDLSIQQNRNIMSQWKYANPLKSVHANLSLSHTGIQRHFIYAQHILENGQRLFSLEPLPNHRQTNTISALVGKNISKWRTSLTFRANKSRTSSENLIQNQLLKNRIDNTLFGSRINFDRFSWMGLQLEWLYRLSTSHNSETTTKYTENNYKLGWFVIPFEHHMLYINLDYYNFRYYNNKHTYPFLDLMYRFSVEKRKLDFEVKWSNILQNDTYSRLYFNDVEIVESHYRLRPSQILCSVKFNFR